MACVTNYANINKTNCSFLLGQVTGVWLDTINTGVTFAAGLLEATWTAKIQAVITARMFAIMPKQPYDVTRNLEEAVRPRGNTGIMAEARKGYVSYTFEITELEDDYWAALTTFNAATMYAYFLTSNEQILAASNTTNILPVPVQVFVDPIATSETSDEFARLKITVNVIPTEDYFTKVITPTAFTPSLLDGIIEVTAAVTAASQGASTVIMTVSEYLDNTAITSGFVTAADWIVEKVLTGALQYPTAFTYAAGVWTGTVITLVSGDDYYLYRKTADNATDKTYEMREANKITFTAIA